jgi:Guanylate-binding protein, N-terminal domain
MNNPLDKKREWIGRPDEPLTGFSWKSGSQRHTTGVVIWSDVFLHDTEDEKMAIILMDTQGLFDTKTSAADNSRIFALGTLISSTQIFNLNGVLQEDQLEYLQMATAYAQFSRDEDSLQLKKPFQKLIFLIRDWMHSKTFNYGLTGGNLYLQENFKTNSEHDNNAVNLRSHIKEMFEDISCFLMPHPGMKAVGNKDFDGRWSAVSEEFKKQLSDLITWMLSPENLKVKAVLDKDLTASEYAEFARKYFEKFTSPDLPDIESIHDVTVQQQYNKLMSEIQVDFKERLQDNEHFTDPKFEEKLSKVYEKAKRSAMKTFDKSELMGGEHHAKANRITLEKTLAKVFNQWKSTSLKKHKSTMEIIQNAQEEKNQLKEKAQRQLQDEKDQHDAANKNLQNELEQQKLKLQIEKVQLTKQKEKQVLLEEKIRDLEKSKLLCEQESLKQRVQNKEAINKLLEQSKIADKERAKIDESKAAHEEKRLKALREENKLLNSLRRQNKNEDLTLEQKLERNRQKIDQLKKQNNK